MIELIAKGDQQANLGVAGDTYNTAVYLSKLSNQAELEVSYVTALGQDSFSKRILETIKNYGINTSYIEQREDSIPGLYAIETDAEGERSFSYWRSQSAARTMFQEPCKITTDMLLELDVIYLSGISIAILPTETRTLLFDFFSQFKEKGGKVVFDNNYRPSLWESMEIARASITKMWELADIALPSLDDELALFNETSEQEVFDRLAKAGVEFGALKRGSQGPASLGQAVKQQTYELTSKVVDTTAAGDSFNAGFLNNHLIGGSLEESMMAGHNLASKVIQASGAIVEI